MKISLDTLSRRQTEVLNALKRRQRVLVSHKGKEVAVLQPIADVDRDETDQDRLRRHPAFGMWADREDLADPSAHVRQRRQRRRGRLTARMDGLEGGGA